MFDEKNPPQDIDEAISRREALIDQTKELDAQLGEPNRVNPMTGLRLRRFEYEEWRSRALHARRMKEKEIVYLKRWIRDRRPPLPQEVLIALKLLIELQKEGVEFTEVENGIIDSISRFVQ